MIATEPAQRTCQGWRVVAAHLDAACSAGAARSGARSLPKPPHPVVDDARTGMPPRARAINASLKWLPTASS